MGERGGKGSLGVRGALFLMGVWNEVDEEDRRWGEALGFKILICGPATAFRQVAHIHDWFAFVGGVGLQLWLGMQQTKQYLRNA